MIMRTVPKQLAIFRDVVKGHGDKAEVSVVGTDYGLGNERTQHIEVESRAATSVIVQPAADKLRVVVQGFMKNKFIGSSVALDEVLPAWPWRCDSNG